MALGISVAPAQDPTTCPVTINLFDGTRQLMKPGTDILLTVFDGAQNQLFRGDVAGPSPTLKLPIHHNLSDNYRIVAFSNGYVQAGFEPVKVGSNSPQNLDLMLLPKEGDFHFAKAKWSNVTTQKPELSKIITAGLAGGDPGRAYGDVMESKPSHLACLLNIGTALENIWLPVGTPLSYLKQVDLAKLADDRIFTWADAEMVEQLNEAAQHKTFTKQNPADLKFHMGATSSFKQNQFGEANVQITFHENDKQRIENTDCILVEVDIDYFKDSGAHFLLEVLPNWITGNLSDPKVVYVLRWIAGQHAGIPNFDPLYTIEA